MGVQTPTPLILSLPFISYLEFTSTRDEVITGTMWYRKRLLNRSFSTSSLSNSGVKWERNTVPIIGNGVQDDDSFVAYVVPYRFEIPTYVRKIDEMRTEALQYGHYEYAECLFRMITRSGFKKIDDEDRLLKKYPVRIKEIDVPETNMQFATEAKEFLRTLIT